MLKLAPIFKPTNAPTRKLRVQSGSYSCPRAWHAKKVRPARQHSHRPASELVKWIFAMMIRVRFQALGVEEHAIKSRRRAGRGADGFGRAVINPLHPVSRSYNGWLRVGEIHAVADVLDCIAPAKDGLKLNQPVTICQNDDSRDLECPVGAGNRRQVSRRHTDGSIVRVWHSDWQTGGNKILQHEVYALIDVKRAPINYEGIAVVRPHRIIQPVGQPRHDDARGWHGVRSDICQIYSLFHQPSLRVVNHRGGIRGDQLPGETGDNDVG